MRQYRASHPEYAARARASVAAWRERNPEKVREQWKRQTKKRSEKGPRVRHTGTPCVRCGALDRTRSGTCRPCNRERDRLAKLADPEKFNARARERQRRHVARLSADQRRERNRAGNLSASCRRLGITVEQYHAMVAAQSGLCAICQKLPVGRSPYLHIDHNHTTGVVRELLCPKCNTGIGLFDETPELFAAALAYLQKHSG